MEQNQEEQEYSKEALLEEKLRIDAMYDVRYDISRYEAKKQEVIDFIVRLECHQLDELMREIHDRLRHPHLFESTVRGRDSNNCQENARSTGNGGSTTKGNAKRETKRSK